MLPVVVKWARALLGARLTGHQCRDPHHCWKGNLLTAQGGCICRDNIPCIKDNTEQAGDFKSLHSKAWHDGPRTVKSPYVQLYSTVRHQVWNTSVSLLPELHNICFFSHWSKPGHLQGSNTFSVCSRARWECLPRQSTNWQIREGLGWRRPKQLPKFHVEVQCADLVNGPYLLGRIWSWTANFIYHLA